MLERGRTAPRRVVLSAPSWAPTAWGTFPCVAASPTATGDENLSRDISRSMVALFKEYVGRGPSHAHSYIHDDLVVVVMRDTMITAEHTLAEEGEQDLVRGLRRVFEAKFRDDANAIVERLTGRQVEAFLSDHNVEEDVMIEAFVLHQARNRR
jgi:uncharacterized protein YbcI